MIKFLLKGLLRDHHRSLFPVIIVSLGVFLTTVLFSFISGVINDLIDSSARFDTGHLKVMSAPYSRLADQLPNDLALTGSDDLISSLHKNYPDYEFTARIKFAGLLDIPDENGETKAQSPVFGMAVDLLSPESKEPDRLNLNKALIKGHLPRTKGEILLSDELSEKTGIGIGQKVTLLSSSANGSMAVQNFILSGTVEFGVAAMNKGAMIADITDIRYALEMPGGAGEILGFKKDMFYKTDEAEKIKNDFNAEYTGSNNQYKPVMFTLKDQNGLGEYLDYVNSIGLIIVLVFLVAMSIVLLNTGLMSGIRRYGEVGVRLALGESKNMIYKSMLWESILIGLAGSLIGTALGLALSYYFQEVGLDMTGALRNSSIMLSNRIRARISFTAFYIGFIPGLIATLIGTALSGIQIFKRQTASLFKELEA